MIQHQTDRAHFYADTLLWQSRVRVGLAVVIGIAAYLVLQTNATTRPLLPVVVTLLAYLAVVSGVAVVAAFTRHVGPWGVTVTVIADLGYLFAVTVLVSTPQYYNRILILSFAPLYLTDLYYGRGQALIAMVAVVLGYLITISVAITHGASVLWAEEIWTVVAFTVVAATYFFQYAGWHRRLGAIVRLLDRAENGEFASPYDIEADAHPDAVTMVGAAYNRVREQISSLVLTDPLTGCVNRRGFDQELTRELARATRANTDFSLLALDIDFFKTVNDTRGHLAGDAVLRELGALLKRARRAGDVVARTGGEEFSIILPETSLAGAQLVATRLCDAVRAQEFLPGDHPVRLTMSIGVVSRSADLHDDDLEELKKRSDDALYHAKRSGRDCVQIWTSSLVPRRSGGRITESLRMIKS